MRVISLYSIKGGVGKTTAAVNFAYVNARDCNRTLILDLDPQASASFFFRVRPMKKQSAKIMVAGKKKASDFIRATDFENLDLLPSDISFRKLDVRLDRAKHSKRRLSATFTQFEDEYDTVFVDCPPNITLLSENIFRVSQALLIPVIPTVLSRRTYLQVRSFLDKKNISIDHVIPFFSMVDLRKKLHREQMEELWRAYPEFLKHYIPHRSEIEQMGEYRAPILAAHPTSVNSLAIEETWREAVDRMAP